jgi:hypothetical protein
MSCIVYNNGPIGSRMIGTGSERTSVSTERRWLVMENRSMLSVLQLLVLAGGLLHTSKGLDLEEALNTLQETSNT